MCRLLVLGLIVWILIAHGLVSPEELDRALAWAHELLTRAGHAVATMVTAA